MRLNTIGPVFEVVDSRSPVSRLDIIGSALSCQIKVPFEVKYYRPCFVVVNTIGPVSKLDTIGLAL